MLQTFNVKDLLQKEVVGFGNGSIVYTPKKWIGKKVFVILEEKPLDIMAEVLEILKQHLGCIEGIFLFGSFARNEQSKQSDIDVLVIANKKLVLEKKSIFDFLVKTKKEFLTELSADSTLFLRQAIIEAKPIMNESLLQELREFEAKPAFEGFFDNTLDAFKRIKESLESQKASKFLESSASVYSLILRLKTLFLIQCYKNRIAFSNKNFVELIKKHGFSEKTANSLIETFRAERDERKTSTKILLEDAEKLFEAAKIEFLKAEALVKK